MTKKGTVASIILGIDTYPMSAQYMAKTQNLPQFSLKCYTNHPGIHIDPAIGAQTESCLLHCNG